MSEDVLIWGAIFFGVFTLTMLKAINDNLIKTQDLLTKIESTLGDSQKILIHTQDNITNIHSTLGDSQKDYPREGWLYKRAGTVLENLVGLRHIIKELPYELEKIKKP